ncbi:MAG TPA: acireductone synthase [Pirellulaceae bacterium]|nr:acireductone synthase [Pirellulaceae bacterium]
MIPRGILLDIEGTTSSVSFVYDVMFPFVRRELQSYLRAHWGEPALSAAVDQIARDAGHGDFHTMLRSQSPGGRAMVHPPTVLHREVERLMDGDVKATGLKQLQGLIWEAGFASGELKAHVYDDVPPALRDWHARGIDLRIYSSGSIQAQKLFFGHTIAGNLLPLLSGHYDTTTGPKKEAASYHTIAADFGLAPSEILFLSDVVAELDAARTAGMQTALVIRPGNAAAADGHAEIKSFSDLECGDSSPL